MLAVRLQTFVESRKAYVGMSRTLRKAVDAAKQKKETELHLPDEGIAHLEEVPQLCELSVYAYRYIYNVSCIYINLYIHLPLCTQTVIANVYM